MEDKPLAGEGGTGSKGIAARLPDVLAALCYGVTAAATGLFLVILIGSMLTRLAGHPLRASEELSSLFFVWACFGGAALAYRRGAHIRLTFLPELLPLAWQVRLRETGILAAMLFLAVVVTQAVILMRELRGATMPISGLPQWLAYLPAPVFGAIMIVFAFESLLRRRC